MEPQGTCLEIAMAEPDGAITGRDRVLAVLSGKTPDRMPVDVGATEFTGVSAEAYLPMKRHLGVEGGRTRVMNPFNGSVRIERTVREKLAVDAAGLFVEPRRWKSARLPSGSACLMPERWSPEVRDDGTEIVSHAMGDFTLVRRPGESWFSYESDVPPLADCSTTSDIARRQQSIAVFDWPYHADELASEFGVRARSRREETTGALVLNARARLIGGAHVLRGEEIFRDMEERPELAHAILGRLADAFVARLTDLLPETAPYADVVCVAEGPAGRLTIEQYRKYVRPLHERLYTHIKKTSQLPLVVFAKGLGVEIIRELVELGVDGVGLAAFPGTATPAELRKACGDDIAIWGVGVGADFLERLTPESAKAEVERVVSAAGGPSRCIFALGEPVPAGAAPENLLAALEAARALVT